jgi:tRNA dimethylallyltransferase
MASRQPQLIFVIGCTACGKAGVGFELARRMSAEIVVIDSMKVYRRMNIGTATPSQRQQEEVPYHMIDVVDPSSQFSVADYLDMAEPLIAELHRRERPIVVVGGTALYIKAMAYGLLESPGEDAEFRAQLREEAQAGGNAELHARLQLIDPDAADRIHRNDYRRIERALEVYHLTGTPISTLQTQWNAQPTKYDTRIIGLRREKDAQSRRINERVRGMISGGLIGEVIGLHQEPAPLSKQARRAVGYAEILDHLDGRLSLDDAVERIKINTRRLAKHQRTWFRRFENVTWFDLEDDDTVDAVTGRVQSWLSSVKP